MRVLISPDKFKGTLSAIDVAEAIARGWSRARPEDQLIILPISDGGDGFGQLLAGVLKAEERSVDTVDAAHRALRAPWWWLREESTALVESARIIGIALLPPGRYHPFDLDTEGLGRALAFVGTTCQPNETLVGIGGSATNDAGFGAARGAGWRFLDQAGHEIRHWPDLTRLHRIIPPEHFALTGTLRVAVDVANPLLGPSGATRVYGPQKGLRPEDFSIAEAALERLVEVVEQSPELPHGLHEKPGSGAAGGLGYGLQVFFGGQLEPGFDLYASYTGLERRLKEADLVITGEGSLDRTSIEMGKGVGRLAQLAAQRAIPCIAIVGLAKINSERARQYFSRIYQLVPDLTDLSEAMSRPAYWIEKAAELAAKAYGAS